jgi:hypothetical protein
LKRNAGVIMDRVRNRVPAFMERQLNTITQKTTPQFALPIGLIFILTCISAFLAAEVGQYPFFLLASSLFFLHGFMHLGQAILLRRYIPAMITSLLVAIPYGAILFWRLLGTGIVNIPGLLGYFFVAIVLGVPFIIGMHILGEFVYKRMIHAVIGEE